MRFFYDGYGIGCELRDSEFVMNALSKSQSLEQKPIPITGFFYLDERQNKRFELIGDLEVTHFTGVLLDDGVEFFLAITDQHSNLTPFKITKNKSIPIYKQDNGNALRIFFDDEEQQTSIENTINPVETLSENKMGVYKERDNDFIEWFKNNENLARNMKKAEIRDVLFARKPKLWASGFDDWWKQQNIYKAPRGRKK